MKATQKSKTIWFNLLALLVALAEWAMGEGSGPLSAVTGVPHETLLPSLLMVQGLANIVLRFFTREPLAPVRGNGLKFLSLAMLLPALLLSSGCNDKEKQWYRSLKADQVAYLRITEEIAQQCEANRISEDRCTTLEEISERWGSAHNAAVTALLVYHHSKSQTNEQTVLEALLEASAVVADLRRAWQQGETDGQDRNTDIRRSNWPGNFAKSPGFWGRGALRGTDRGFAGQPEPIA